MSLFARGALTSGTLARIGEEAARDYVERALGGTATVLKTPEDRSEIRGDLRHRVGDEVYYYVVKVNRALISAAQRERDLAWNRQSGGNAVRYIQLDVHPVSGKILGIATSGDWSRDSTA